ncbi:MAG: hypothetical protein AAFZ65_16180 [Planctomycetota bacterium]
MKESLFYTLPIWLRWLSLFAILGGAVWTGHRIGKRKEGGKDEVVVTSMLALVSLVIAFTYGFTVNHYETRKRVVHDEAVALRGAFLRADLAAEPQRTQLREAILEYARTRVATKETLGSDGTYEGFMERTLEAQAELWPLVRQLLAEQGTSPFTLSVAAKVSTLLELHSRRVAVSFDRLPVAVLMLLVVLVSLTLGTAARDSTTTRLSSRSRLISFAAILSAMIAIVTDFERGQEGFIRVSQGSLELVIQAMEAELADS